MFVFWTVSYSCEWFLIVYCTEYSLFCSAGIGRAVALAYAREGANIVISYLNEDEDANEIKQAIEESGKKCLLIPGDIQDPNHCQNIIDKTIKEFGKLDILVNNAAYQGKGTEDITKIDHERVTRTFNTNIVGENCSRMSCLFSILVCYLVRFLIEWLWLIARLAMFSLVRSAIPHLKPGGIIINVGSIQAYDPSYQILDYACTKAAIVAFTKGLSEQLLPKGIRVNAVAPGPVWTPLVIASFDAEKNSKFGEKYPIKRPGTYSLLTCCVIV